MDKFKIKHNKQSKFKSWFVAQFGRYPDMRKYLKLKQDIADMESCLGHLKNQYRDEEILEEQRRAAMYLYMSNIK